MQTQINKSLFNRLEEDSSKKIDIQINDWIHKQLRKRYLMINGSCTLNPTIQNQKKCIATSKRRKQIIPQE